MKTEGKLVARLVCFVVVVCCPAPGQQGSGLSRIVEARLIQNGALATGASCLQRCTSELPALHKTGCITSRGGCTKPERCTDQTRKARQKFLSPDSPTDPRRVGRLPARALFASLSSSSFPPPEVQHAKLSLGKSHEGLNYLSSSYYVQSVLPICQLVLPPIHRRFSLTNN